MTRPNCGPCAVYNCNKNNTKFRGFTKFAFEKAQRKGTINTFSYLKVGDQLCQIHYNNIVEPDRGNKVIPLKDLPTYNTNTNINLSTINNIQINKGNCNNLYFFYFFYIFYTIYLINILLDFFIGEQLNLLTKVLYNIQRKQGLPIELDPDSFCNLIEEQEPCLKGFFKAFENALNPKTRLQKTRENGKKAIVGFCYLLAGLGNKFVNNLKLEIGLYLVACGTSREGIETLSAMGLSACAKTVDKYRKEIFINHPKEVNEYFTIYVSYLEYLIF